MEVKTDPSVSPNTFTHQLCHPGTLLNLTDTQLPMGEKITPAVLSLEAMAAREAAQAVNLAQQLGLPS